MKRTIRTVASVVLVGTLAIPVRGEILEQVLVKVNGDILTKTDLEQRQIAALRGRMGQDIDPESLKHYLEKLDPQDFGRFSP